ncbi:RHS repeat-associated core domain-containing protein [Ralstonia mannitolilytica]|uniref:RHS repeat-associated core domain-containing protein n=3 Tax=Ralstonia mannitolilytica TaxID=105219 RepID=UPI003B8427ED
MTRYVFNSNKALTSVTRGQGTPVAQARTYNWNTGTNLLDSVTDALGRTTAYQYDRLGNMTQVTAASGTSSAATTKIVWDLNYSRPTSITDPNNNTLTLNYDNLGNLVRSTDALNHSVALTYDSQGRPTSIADALSATTTFSYSGADLQTVTDPLGNAASRSTDAVGRPIGRTDPLGHRSYLAYDTLNRLTSVTDPKGGVAQVSYDANGNVLTQVDQNNNTTSFAYDGRNRLTRTTDALGHVSTLAYEPGGRVSQVVNNKGQATNRTYDALGRPTLISFGAAAGGGAPVSTIALTWDAGNRLTQLVDSVGGTITRSYDVLDRLTKETTPQGSVSYTYDLGGRRRSMTVAGQPTVSYSWDAANRLTQIQQAAGSTNGNTAQTISFSYDAANRRTSTTYANGIVATYSYDKASQLTGITYNKADGTLIGDLGYTYDANGQRTNMGGSLAQVNPGTAVGSTQFNANNQLTNWNGQSLTYDANGNLTSDGANTYVWDERNQLRSIGGAVTASFQYDALGRRTNKTIGSKSTGYLYDGANFVQEQSGGAVTANLVTGPRLDEPYLRETSAGTHSLLPDALGSILMATDAAQATVTSYSYDAYGATLQTGTNDNSQQYTGRENDGTGLYYYRARYYSPQMGRFISQDPIGWASGQTNNYAYVNGNPISYTDPEGKFGLVGALVGAGLDIGMQMIIGGKSLKCVNISSVLTSAAVGAFTPGLLTVGGLAVGAEKTVAMWGWLGARDAAIWQGVGAVTGATLKTATKSDPWTIGDDCECKK